MNNGAFSIEVDGGKLRQALAWVEDWAREEAGRRRPLRVYDEDAGVWTDADLDPDTGERPKRETPAAYLALGLLARDLGLALAPTQRLRSSRARKYGPMRVRVCYGSLRAVLVAAMVGWKTMAGYIEAEELKRFRAQEDGYPLDVEGALESHRRRSTEVHREVARLDKALDLVFQRRRILPEFVELVVTS